MSIEARPLPGTEGVERPFWSPDSRFVAFMAGGEAEEGRHRGRTAADHLRRAQRRRRILESGRRHPLRRTCDRSAACACKPQVVSANRSCSRRAKRKGSLAQAGRSSCRTASISSITIVDPTSPEMTLTVGNIDSTMMQDAVQDDDARAVRRARLPAVRPRPNAGRAEVRRRSRRRSRVSRCRWARAWAPTMSGWRRSPYRATACWCIGAASWAARAWCGSIAAARRRRAIDAPADYRDTSLSPDGTRLVYDVGDGGPKGDLWIRDLTRGVSSRFTFDAGRRGQPAMVTRRPADRLHVQGEGGRTTSS